MIDQEFSDKIAKAQPIKEKVDKLDLIEIKNFCTVKITLRGKLRVKIERKYLQTMCLTKDLYIQYIKCAQNSTVKTVNSIGKSLKDMSRHFTKEDE